MIKVNSTGSIANSYNLVCNNETLLIDLGLSYKDMLLKINNINEVVGGILTHWHWKFRPYRHKNLWRVKKDRGKIHYPYEYSNWQEIQVR